MKITNVKIYGLEESAIASGYPMMIKTPSEDVFEQLLFDASIEKEDWKPFDRLCNLGATNQGEGHDCAIKGVIVHYDLTCNHIMLPQLLRYHFHDIISSQSKMHKIIKMDLKSCCGKRVREDVINACKEEIDKYIFMLSENNKNPINKPYTKEYLEEQYETIMENIPLGLELTMRMHDNYLQLKSKYFQRHPHKMSFWRDYCDWIETLPLMDRILKLNQ